MEINPNDLQKNRNRVNATNILLVLILLSIIFFGYYNSLSSLEKFRLQNMGVSKTEVKLSDGLVYFDCQGKIPGQAGYGSYPKKVSLSRFGIVFDEYYDLGLQIPKVCKCVGTQCPPENTNIRTVPVRYP